MLFRGKLFKIKTMLWNKIKKGNHDTSPPDIPWVRFKVTELVWNVKMFSGTDYNILPDKDQWDINKGGGVSFNLLDNTKDSIMWGWRFNPKTNCHDYFLYTHKNGDRIISDIMLQVPKGELVEIVFKRDGLDWDCLFIHGKTVAKGTYTQRKTFTLNKEITLYFGGENNEEGEQGGVAPQDMLIYIRKEKK